MTNSSDCAPAAHGHVLGIDLQLYAILVGRLSQPFGLIFRARNIFCAAMTAPDRRLIFLLNVAYRRLQRWTEKELAPSGLSGAQAGVLFWLGSHDGALIGEVAEALDIVPSAMTGLIDRMVNACLVERRPDGDDRRAFRIYLTAAGRRLRKQAAARSQALNASLMEGFSEAEIAIVARWLASLQTKFPREAELQNARPNRKDIP